jgi:hypothetical protein
MDQIILIAEKEPLALVSPRAQALVNAARILPAALDVGRIVWAVAGEGLAARLCTRARGDTDALHAFAWPVVSRAGRRGAEQEGEERGEILWFHDAL